MNADCIAVLPERVDGQIDDIKEYLSETGGICTDFVKRFDKPKDLKTNVSRFHICVDPRL